MRHREINRIKPEGLSYGFTANDAPFGIHTFKLFSAKFITRYKALPCNE